MTSYAAKEATDLHFLGNTILIDISGIGGMTHEWRAAKLQDEISPFDLPGTRIERHGACGKLSATIASGAGNSTFATDY
ncbi:hypothetical protein N7474_009779 [Penicillium riverlandense]|uniref:uncharacterized protein n=1 Tax=Penicillium riverlandense TaxID=1903569 RepID=UPI0025482D5D|nr:uncharacterized protein N7474_009779 [Penicillium riverlandense]KAJ5808510.1 hypothetical protein N7474_009779 [Penicillium riverlandense]